MVVGGSDSFPAGANIAAQYQVMLNDTIAAVALKVPMPAVALKVPMPDAISAAANIAARRQAMLSDTIAAAALKIPVPDAFGAATLKAPMSEAFRTVANVAAQQRAMLSDTIAAMALKFEPRPIAAALDMLMHAALDGDFTPKPAADVGERVALIGEQVHSTDLEAEWSEALLRYAALVVFYAVGFALLLSLLAASGYGETALSILVTVLIGLPKPPPFE
jgi:hypothetical protein